MSPRIDAALTALVTPIQKTAALNLRGIGAGVRTMTPHGGVPVASRMATQAASTRGMPMRPAAPAPRPRPQLTWANPAAAPAPAIPNSGGAATMAQGPDISAILRALGRGAGAGLDFPIGLIKSNPRAALALGTAGGLGAGIKYGLLDPVRQALEGGMVNPNNR